MLAKFNDGNLLRAAIILFTCSFDAESGEGFILLKDGVPGGLEKVGRNNGMAHVNYITRRYL